MFVSDAGDTSLPAGEIVDADEFVAANKAARAEGRREASYRPVHAYGNNAEALMAYSEGVIGLHAPIMLRVEKTINGEPAHKLVKTSVGRIISTSPSRRTSATWTARTRSTPSTPR